ncbi:HET-domain-containing protein [Xylaria arbuscula]|nr:HET-domain-containing protein [Xylaria arbuscula]
MRLLNTSTFEVKYLSQSRVQSEGYAILSHRWLSDGEEITFQDIHKYTKTLKSHTRPFILPQLDKIRGACDVARDKGLRWLWMDTCCIEKNDTREYAEAINSMFRWYRDAKLCITYLSDVQDTNRPFLTGQKRLYDACIAVKMSWMSGRRTTYPEDMTYSMIGIFNITMPFVYGESGPRAFRRLQEILLASPFMDESLFAWKMVIEPNAGGSSAIPMESEWESAEWGLLASSPDYFKESGDIEVPVGRAAQVRTFRMVPQGLEAPIRKRVWLGPSGSASTQKNKANGRREEGSIASSLVSLVVKSVISHTFGLRANKSAMEDYAFTLNCFRWGPSGQPQNVMIHLRPVYVDEVTIGGGSSSIRNETKGAYLYPYMECKRIHCHELGLTEEPVTNYGNGIVFQPPPRC